MKLKKFHLDALREIFAVGAGSASTALSEMAKKRVVINFPEAKEVLLEKISETVGKPNEVVATAYLHLSGVITKNEKIPVGELLLIFPEEEARHFTDLLFKGKKQIKNPVKLHKDAIKETANILSGASTHAISEYFNFTVEESLPTISVDMLNATIDGVISSLGYKAEKVLVFKTDFQIEEHHVKSYFMILFHPAMYPLLVDKIKQN